MGLAASVITLPRRMGMPPVRGNVSPGQDLQLNFCRVQFTRGAAGRRQPPLIGLDAAACLLPWLMPPDAVRDAAAAQRFLMKISPFSDARRASSFDYAVDVSYATCGAMLHTDVPPLFYAASFSSMLRCLMPPRCAGRQREMP